MKYIAAIFLSSGAALIVYVMSGVSLLGTFLSMVFVGTVLGSMIYRKLDVAQKARLRKRVFVGIAAGFLATLAYDGFRLMLVHGFSYKIWPFDIFSVFGRSLLGDDAKGIHVEILGVLYHFINGIAFGVAFTIYFGKRGIWPALGWAFFLEAMMLVVYPNWLTIKLMDEFLQISVLGHVIYGLTLGYTSKMWLNKYE